MIGGQILMHLSEPRRATLRTFALGAGCGFVAGAVLIASIVSRYGYAAAPPERQRAAASDGVSDGMADVDSPVIREAPRPSPAAAPGPSGPDATPTMGPAPSAELAGRRLDVPVEGVRREELVRSFDQQRSGSRAHEAIDILAPRNTVVKAVDDGTVARLFYSKAGGITVYQFDPSEKFCYYYAHLERYADGLHEGDRIRKGQVLGYVGTSGNAPKDTPHLHFAVFRLTADKHWWEGTPIDPYDFLK
jgi:murein DD-endopeptidase MepM/ murein hydrolase activator NlpD